MYEAMWNYKYESNDFSCWGDNTLRLYDLNHGLMIVQMEYWSAILDL